MFGENPRLNPLELRKELLRAESELNRAQMAGDLAALATVVRTLTDRAKSLGTIGSSAAALVAGLAAFQMGQPDKPRVKTSWLQTALKSASVISNLWLAFGYKAGD
jgi:hypothetical protein